MNSGINTFKLPEEVKQGTYTVEYRCMAINGIESESMGECFNGDIDEYGAYSRSEVSVIGRIYDFQVTDGDSYVVGTRDKNGATLKEFTKKLLPNSFSLLEEKHVKLSIITMGNLSDNTHLEGSIKYYYLNENGGDLQQVDLYSEQIKKLESNISFDRACCEKNGDNTYVWHMDYKLPAFRYPVPLGRNPHR